MASAERPRKASTLPPTTRRSPRHWSIAVTAPRLFTKFSEETCCEVSVKLSECDSKCPLPPALGKIMLCIHHNSRRDSRPRLSCRATARPGALMHKATMRKLIMCKLIAILSLISLTSLGAWAQTSPAKKTPAVKPPATMSAGPTAVIDTAAGKMTCKLFPDKAPLGVENFIGLAEGTKDWTNPVSHAKKHGVPL